MSTLILILAIAIFYGVFVTLLCACMGINKLD